jgi:hypothetical protein
VQVSTTHRDQAVVEQYLVQQSLGALTVTDERYRDLGDDGWLAA